MPVVFWDEFDCQNYDWLQRLLAPMQDGKFQEGQIIHPIGKCVFVFAGGTSADFENFGPPPGDMAKKQEWVLKKGPDFKSRLSGYLNVLGPNQRKRFDPNNGTWTLDPADVWFPVRRALLLRGFLGRKDQEPLPLDSGLLSALLEVGKYEHGARSMEKVVEQLRDRGLKGVLRRSDLPPAEITSMHVDYDAFFAIVNRELQYQQQIEGLAPAIHEFYLGLAKTEGWTPKYLQKWPELPDEIKADNFAAAARLPKVLALVGLYVLSADKLGDGIHESDEEINALIETNLELLAEAEHDGWMDFKFRNGWRYGKPRSDSDRIHDRLVPYRDLEEEQKHKDRNSVRRFSSILARINYRLTGDQA